MNDALVATGLSKSFPGVKALEGVNLTLKPGTVHALLGENGAGKSTLIKVITGVHAANEGVLALNGEPRTFASPVDATRAGVGVVHQERNLIPDFSVEENITLQDPPRKNGIIDRAKRTEQAAAALKSIGVDLDLKAKVQTLSVAQMQLVEIAKALVTKTRVLLLDEPTASISGSEADKLFEVVRVLRDSGTAILFVSHKLEEVFEICDTVTVLRDGVSVLESANLAEYSRSQIVELMVGRQLAALATRLRTVDRTPVPALELVGLNTSLGHKNVSLDVHRGEILGMYGLVGAGRSELARTVLGLHSVLSGEVRVNGRAVKIRGVGEALNSHRIGYVTENRKEEGVFLDFTVTRNIAVTVWRRMANRFGMVRRSGEESVAARFIDSLGIKVSGPDQLAGNLSGGNQQKVSLAKWLAAETEILIIDEPTVGVDVRTKAAFHELILDLADQGLAILLISSDLPEIVNLADNILVMNGYMVLGEIENTKNYPTISRQVMGMIHDVSVGN